jgi:hypothetical protein
MLPKTLLARYRSFCYVGSMKDATAPAQTPFERFKTLLQAAVSVPKSEIDRREAEYKKQRKARKSAKK